MIHLPQRIHMEYRDIIKENDLFKTKLPEEIYFRLVALIG